MTQTYQILQASGPFKEVSKPEGILRGIGVTYGKPFMQPYGPTILLSGSLDASIATLQKEGKKTPLLYQHNKFHPIGWVEIVGNTNEELLIEAHLLIGKVPLADQAFALAEERVLTGFSVGVSYPMANTVMQKGVRVVRAGTIIEFSLVTFPAMDGARVTSVAEDPRATLILDNGDNLEKGRDKMETNTIEAQANNAVLAELEQLRAEKSRSVLKQEVLAEVAPNFEKINEVYAQNSELTEKLEKISAEFRDMQQKIYAPNLGDETIQAENQAFADFVRTGRIEAASPLTTITPSTVSIPVNVSRQITQILQAENPARALFSAVTVPSMNWKAPVWDPSGTEIVVGSETTPMIDITQSTSFNEAVSAFWTLKALPSFSKEMLQDSFADIPQLVAQAIASQMVIMEATGFLTGDGGAGGQPMPKGLLTAPMSQTADGLRPYGTFQCFDVAADGITYDVLQDMVLNLRPGYLSGCRWIMNRRTLFVVRTIKDQFGRFIWNQGEVNDSPQGTLFGYPITTVDTMPNVAGGMFPIAFGNFKRAYIITDVRGLELEYFNQRVPGYIQLYATKRTGGTPLDTNAAKFLRIQSQPPQQQAQKQPTVK